MGIYKLEPLDVGNVAGIDDLFFTNLPNLELEVLVVAGQVEVGRRKFKYHRHTVHPFVQVHSAA